FRAARSDAGRRRGTCARIWGCATPWGGLYDPAADLEGVPALTRSAREPRDDGVLDHLRFMFAVGIECSYPTIEGNYRVDQLRDTGHYEHWKTDLRLVRDLGLRYLRYGPPLYKVFTGPGE